MSQPIPFRFVWTSALLLVGLCFIFRLINWVLRIKAFRKTMPVIPTLFPPDSYYRRMWPKDWQTFHHDWHMCYKRTIYQRLDSDIFALVCLFEYDKVFITDAAAVLDLKIAKPREFPKDMQIFSKVLHSKVYQAYPGKVCGLWEKCSVYNRRRMEAPSQDHSPHVHSERLAPRPRRNNKAGVADDGVLGTKYVRGQGCG